MQLPDSLIKNIEVEYLRQLTNILKEGKADRTLAKTSAQAFLKLLPFADDNDMLLKLGNFGEEFPLFTKLHVYALGLIEELKTKEVLEKMRKLMKDNDIDGAIQLIDK
ncbi:MAG: hypothetical protein US54_C0064G0015 [Candidatus Roizmanbacteria bacterium GW2011_GWA2_37_7]|uniref:Uncharacterized protein n=1 Tax=Candidatus Roizmanbacteria bacterium GW2011_GWA2_37_7 TaxID=1618481 RepID=A0A0G0H302_9BACT|nr:MAG: hypothetical protein US54_C0064G0015 [Candidatus Roizmanbacteria bacterium GW2011_GWA2_37_7]